MGSLVVGGKRMFTEVKQKLEVQRNVWTTASGAIDILVSQAQAKSKPVC